MLDRTKIGYDNGERFVDVERSQVRLFCTAIGETNPIFLDDAAARAAGHPASPVPPTYLQTLNYMAPQKQDLVLDVLGAELGKMLHGEQRHDFVKPIYVGERIRLKTRIADIYDKKGGALEFIVLETEFHDDQGELRATMRSVAVLRH
jgi:acyl dehydratase